MEKKEWNLMNALRAMHNFRQPWLCVMHEKAFLMSPPVENSLLTDGNIHGCL